MQMSPAFDQKEDLRLRMADLEKKLAKSEEERNKLEKTCNVLMRAFREEEKMQYKALNKKYEKFLEDCSVRKRRNDIIMRSLCRIEDRSRALFAKTERLKLLKDRYISYLKINDVRKEEVNSQSCRTVQSLPSSENISKDPAFKLVQWKTPVATDREMDRLRETRGDSFLGRENPRTTSGDSLARITERNYEKSEVENFEEKPRHEGRKTSEINVHSWISDVEQRGSVARDGPSPDKFKLGLNDRQINYYSEKINNRISSEHVSENYREKKVIGEHESVEKVKKSHSVEEDISWGKDDEGPDLYVRKTEQNAERSMKSPTQTQNKYGNDYHLPASTPNVTTHERNEENPSKNVEFDTKTDSQMENHEESICSSENDLKSLPKGLDGVDYQNETYPESYYEQPVHQNHASIASDVILEEDETEEELDEEVNDLTPDGGRREPETNAGNGHESTSWARSPGHGAADEPRPESEANKVSEESGKGPEQTLEEVKSQASRSEQSLEAKQSDKSDGIATERKKTPGKSNLFHLLESDSESFQIEHGDANSGNEDSDFDFSFRQN